jgi:hypothetical protein
MRNILERYLPERSVAAVFALIKENNVHLKIVKYLIKKGANINKDVSICYK